MRPDNLIPGGWTSEELEGDQSWRFDVGERGRADLLALLDRFEDDVDLLSLTARDVDLGAAAETIDAATAMALDGLGVALVRGLPRDGLSEERFALLTWLIGLHIGVARPQNKMTSYLSPVRNTGTVYRSVTGRGYSSNAELDFHVDGADLVALTCYNVSPEGGQSLVSSSIAAHNAIATERPDLLAELYEPLTYNRQGEEAVGQSPIFDIPVFARRGDRLFCTWARNRVESAQKREDVAPLTETRREALDYLDAVVRRPKLMHRMAFRPGDMQILSNHVALHSRTAYVDHEEPERWRLLYRLWLAPKDAPELPETWHEAYATTSANTVRGGNRGLHHDRRCIDFESRQAVAVGMRISELVDA